MPLLGEGENTAVLLLLSPTDGESGGSNLQNLRSTELRRSIKIPETEKYSQQVAVGSDSSHPPTTVDKERG